MRNSFLALLVAAVVALSPATALAAPSVPPLAVEVNGTLLTQPEAQPLQRDGVIYLPLRAVAEAMDYTVTTEEHGIFLRRGEVSICLNVGETALDITRTALPYSAQLPQAPFVDTALWRTYVPLVFFGAAAGCATGFDHTANTALVGDVEGLLSAMPNRLPTAGVLTGELKAGDTVTKLIGNLSAGSVYVQDADVWYYVNHFEGITGEIALGALILSTIKLDTLATDYATLSQTATALATCFSTWNNRVTALEITLPDGRGLSLAVEKDAPMGEFPPSGTTLLPLSSR